MFLIASDFQYMYETFDGTIKTGYRYKLKNMLFVL